MAIRQASSRGHPGVRTTLPVPRDLLDLIDELVRDGRFGSRSEIVELALRRLSWDLDEEEMFASFEAAAKDPGWVADQTALAEEAAQSGWETIILSEAEDQSS